ncbi:MAG: phospho-N-acetylmuramoyl-pentapeptide-transferase [Elusimicrobiales bacterium]|nr:phospho-N-acetylmuramoyl-pentapeptide-transferase [Elusimicrobiales bacterium]
MLYYLHTLKDYFFPFNLFYYISVRISGAIITSFLIAIIIAPYIIKKLKEYKIQQIQRLDGPKTHLSKSGTPTMGGIIIFISLILSTILWARPDNRFIIVLIISSIMLAFCGWLDDYTKLIKKDPKGAPSWIKFLIQTLTATFVVGYLAINPPSNLYPTHLLIPYTKNLIINLGVFYFFFEMLVIIGSSNAVNLSDGQDGLASGLVIFTALTFIIMSYCAGNIKWANYLKLIYVEGAGEISIFLGAMVGACLGFLWYNAYPAEIFMGDTSSLFLGGTIGISAIMIKHELLLPIAGGMFVIETLSVIIQMLSYKYRNKKRVFLMAPIHHHFELKGIAEPKVTVRFWICGIMLMLLALSSLKIR